AVRALDNAPENVRVVPNGTDFAPPPDEQRDEILAQLGVERPYVLWTGTVEPRKNPEGVVRGFVQATGSFTRAEEELKLYLVGPPGWWSGDVGQLVEERGMADRVRRIHPPLRT